MEARVTNKQSHCEMSTRRVSSVIRARIVKAAIESHETVKYKKFLEIRSILWDEFSFELKKSFFYNLLNKPEIERPKRAERKRTVITPCNIQRVLSIIDSRGGKVSTRKIAKLTQINVMSVQRIMRKELSMHPYKPIKVQKLSEKDKTARFEFCNLMLNKITSDPEYHRKIIFTDETMVETQRSPNRQNDRRWCLTQPYDVHQHSVYAKKVLIWSGINFHLGVLPTYEMPTGHGQGVNQANYQDLLLNRVFPEMQRKFGEQHLRSFAFMQDGAPAHRTLESISAIRTCFDVIIGARGDISWPPRSPDLNPCDYYLWPTVKSRCSEIDDPVALSNEFEQVMNSIDQDEYERAIDNFVTRLRACIAVDGGHFFTH